MKKKIALIVLLSMVMLTIAHHVSAEPVTIPVNLGNLQFGPACPTPPDLGFDPLYGLSESGILYGRDGEEIGDFGACHFVVEEWFQGAVYHRLFVTIATWSFSNGDLNSRTDDYLISNNGATTIHISGEINGGTGDYENAGGTVVGEVIYNYGNSFPIGLFEFHIQ